MYIPNPSSYFILGYSPYQLVNRRISEPSNQKASFQFAFWEVPPIWRWRCKPSTTAFCQISCATLIVSPRLWGGRMQCVDEGCNRQPSEDLCVNRMHQCGKNPSKLEVLQTFVSSFIRSVVKMRYFDMANNCCPMLNRFLVSTLLPFLPLGLECNA